MGKKCIACVTPAAIRLCADYIPRFECVQQFKCRTRNYYY